MQAKSIENKLQDRGVNGDMGGRGLGGELGRRIEEMVFIVGAWRELTRMGFYGYESTAWVSTLVCGFERGVSAAFGVFRGGIFGEVVVAARWWTRVY